MVRTHSLMRPTGIKLWIEPALPRQPPLLPGPITEPDMQHTHHRRLGTRQMTLCLRCTHYYCVLGPHVLIKVERLVSVREAHCTGQSHRTCAPLLGLTTVDSFSGCSVAVSVQSADSAQTTVVLETNLCYISGSPDVCSLMMMHL